MLSTVKPQEVLPCHSSLSTGGINTNILDVHVDMTNATTVIVECTFFQPGYACTIDYGIDPSYTNLVYRDTSSTLLRTTTITLSQELRGNITYYYVVSVESNSFCVRVHGEFQTGIFQWLHACVSKPRNMTTVSHFQNIFYWSKDAFLYSDIKIKSKF